VGIRRTKHAVYELKYHLVWVPKYRAKVLGVKERQYLKKLFIEIAEEYEFHIDTMEVMGDHVHMFIEVPPSYAPARVVQIMKSISAKELYKKYPEIRTKMWSGAIWGEGYFARSVGDVVTSEVIRKYIEYQQNEDKPSQSKMF
jgi:putative transposase